MSGVSSVTVTPVTSFHSPAAPFLYSISVVTFVKVPLLAFIAVSSVAVTPIGAPGRIGMLSVCAVLSVVVELLPFFTMLNDVPNQMLSIASLPSAVAVSEAPFTVYEPLAVKPVNCSAA
ncbi:hypothetical protein D3C71_1314180 [compost metagenome]